MTSNERKILKYQWGANRKAHVKALSQNTGFSADYTWLLCRSLARAGYLKFSGRNECYLLKKGRSRFEDAFLEEVSEEPASHTANITLLTDAAAINAVDNSERPVNIQEEERPAMAEEKVAEAKDKIESGDAPALTSSIDELPDASEKDKEKLVQAGYKSAEDLAQAPVATLIQGLGVSLRKAASWINQARRETGVIQDKREKIKK